MNARSLALGAIIGLVLTAGATAAPSSRVVLGLYKSSDGQSQQDNEIVYHLEPRLAEMGLEVRYHDPFYPAITITITFVYMDERHIRIKCR